MVIGRHFMNLKENKENDEAIKITTKEHIISLGGIYFENILEGFEAYHSDTIEGTKEKLYKEIYYRREENGIESSFVDFYYGNLSKEEKIKLKENLGDKSLSIITKYEDLRQPVFLFLDDDIIVSNSRVK